MKKIVIPQDLKGKALFEFLKANKHDIIKQKKSLPKFTEAVVCTVEKLTTGKTATTKAASAAPALADGELFVKVVANSCWWCDSQFDVLTTNSAKKTIADRKGLIPHLHDHVHQLDAQIGDVQDVYLEDVPLRKLGLDAPGNTQCIIMETIIRRDYNPKVYQLYKDEKVTQHSIALNYVQIELAINDPESEKEFDFWNKYYDKVLNKDVPDETGFFWVVSEIRMLENSGVLFGSNELTPTLETSGKNHSTGAAAKAPKEEPADEEDFNLDIAIITTDFFKNKNIFQ